MLADRSAAFDPGNKAIPIARRLVREFVEAESQGAGLQRIERDVEAYAYWLASATLSFYFIQGLITRAMINRWLMEAVATKVRGVGGSHEK